MVSGSIEQYQELQEKRAQELATAQQKYAALESKYGYSSKQARAYRRTTLRKAKSNLSQAQKGESTLRARNKTGRLARAGRAARQEIGLEVPQTLSEQTGRTIEERAQSSQARRRMEATGSRLTGTQLRAVREKGKSQEVTVTRASVPAPTLAGKGSSVSEPQYDYYLTTTEGKTVSISAGLAAKIRRDEEAAENKRVSEDVAKSVLPSAFFATAQTSMAPQRKALMVAQAKADRLEKQDSPVFFRAKELGAQSKAYLSSPETPFLARTAASAQAVGAVVVGTAGAYIIDPFVRAKAGEERGIEETRKVQAQKEIGAAMLITGGVAAGRVGLKIPSGATTAELLASQKTTAPKLGTASRARTTSVRSGTTDFYNPQTAAYIPTGGGLQSTLTQFARGAKIPRITPEASTNIIASRAGLRTEPIPLKTVTELRSVLTDVVARERGVPRSQISKPTIKRTIEGDGFTATFTKEARDLSLTQYPTRSGTITRVRSRRNVLVDRRAELTMGRTVVKTNEGFGVVRSTPEEFLGSRRSGLLKEAKQRSGSLSRSRAVPVVRYAPLTNVGSSLGSSTTVESNLGSVQLIKPVSKLDIDSSFRLGTGTGIKEAVDLSTSQKPSTSQKTSTLLSTSFGTFTPQTTINTKPTIDDPINTNKTPRGGAVPPWDLQSGGFGSRKSKSKPKKRKDRFSPSITAASLGIKATTKKKSSGFTGFETRGLTI